MSKNHNNAKLPIARDMSEHALAYCLINNQELATPWIGSDDARGIMRWALIDFIVDCRADGLNEREVIREARRYVREYFESGLRPDPIASPAVRVLVHADKDYPLVSKDWFVYILTAKGYSIQAARAMIEDAVRKGKIKVDRVRRGFRYMLTKEPITREIKYLIEKVAEMMSDYPGGIPFGKLKHKAAFILYRGIDSGAALIERALNAGVLRAEVRGNGWLQERFIFPIFKENTHINH